MTLSSHWPTKDSLALQREDATMHLFCQDSHDRRRRRCISRLVEMRNNESDLFPQLHVIIFLSKQKWGGKYFIQSSSALIPKWDFLRNSEHFATAVDLNCAISSIHSTMHRISSRLCNELSMTTDDESVESLFFLKLQTRKLIAEFAFAVDTKCRVHCTQLHSLNESLWVSLTRSLNNVLQFVRCNAESFSSFPPAHLHWVCSAHSANETKCAPQPFTTFTSESLLQLQ